MVWKQNTMSEALKLNKLTLRDIWNNSLASTHAERVTWHIASMGHWERVHHCRGWGIGKGCLAAEELGFNWLPAKGLGALCPLRLREAGRSQLTFVCLSASSGLFRSLSFVSSLCFHSSRSLEIETCTDGALGLYSCGSGKHRHCFLPETLCVFRF